MITNRDRSGSSVLRTRPPSDHFHLGHAALVARVLRRALSRRAVSLRLLAAAVGTALRATAFVAAVSRWAVALLSIRVLVLRASAFVAAVSRRGVALLSIRVLLLRASAVLMLLRSALLMLWLLRTRTLMLLLRSRPLMLRPLMLLWPARRARLSAVRLRPALMLRRASSRLRHETICALLAAETTTALVLAAHLARLGRFVQRPTLEVREQRLAAVHEAQQTLVVA